MEWTILLSRMRRWRWRWLMINESSTVLSSAISAELSKKRGHGGDRKWTFEEHRCLYSRYIFFVTPPRRSSIHIAAHIHNGFIPKTQVLHIPHTYISHTQNTLSVQIATVPPQVQRKNTFPSHSPNSSIPSLYISIYLSIYFLLSLTFRMTKPA